MRIAASSPWTLSDQFEAAGRRPSGFDYLRISLALTIILFHAPLICGGEPIVERLLFGPLRPATFFLVPSFFALSGFLIAGSLERNPLPTFFTLRALRIVPALAAEVLISAVIIGAIFTTLPLENYYTSSGFWAYFQNMVGLVHYRLPGVFLDHPLANNVNGQLWTIPIELECYVVLGVLTLLGITQRTRLLLILTVLVVLAIALRHLYNSNPPPRLNLAPGRMLIITTLFAVWMYKARRSIPFSWPLFWVSLVLTVALLRLMSNLVYMAALPITYVTVFLGLLNPPKSRLLTSGDYSYALYLYSFPIQQSLVALFPWGRNWFLNFIAGIALSSVCAFLSWHLLESKVMGARKTVVPMVERVAAWFLRRRDQSPLVSKPPRLKSSASAKTITHP
jgi:peptidoglycan/LPS O-acetylase OafA/YrhL